ncbi:hypothetical protein POM88_044858 [Heracleum sosnowskyi]|uniref:Uncharacterized protein n=1 Tax=Heracleum sosnowskyi TaxID=360622 RepID=A0AAD8H4P7_9APIA|nr:hypothetical protein POM88_044858 [Heracleum sosnowskyi]
MDIDYRVSLRLGLTRGNTITILEYREKQKGFCNIWTQHSGSITPLRRQGKREISCICHRVTRNWVEEFMGAMLAYPKVSAHFRRRLFCGGLVANRGIRNFNNICWC